jgi:A/G-specific adenine glycosylase
MKRLSPTTIRSFRKTIRDHYRRHGRHDLPWRHTSDPYRILVSEVMLQQTQVPRVVEKYASFVERFPDFGSLARAPLRSVLRAWSGLGYNRRARYLREAAQVVVAKHGGRLPASIEELTALPGVGPATARSVAAFAFSRAHPFIETNIRAVYIHFFFAGRSRVADADIMPLVEQTLDSRNPRVWYNALMDYGVMLKRDHGNPAVRSAHHAVQPRFEGSNRQARGLIVKALAERRMSEVELKSATGLTLARLRPNVAKLVEEGIVARRRGKFGIA